MSVPASVIKGSWDFVRRAEELLGARGVVGVSSWDETDETGASIAARLRDLLARARAAASSAAGAARQRVNDALSALSSAASTAAQWATDVAARADLRSIAREAAFIGGAALGGAVPSWVWLVALLAVSRGTRDVFSD